jgi:hypothetical protein
VYGLPLVHFFVARENMDAAMINEITNANRLHPKMEPVGIN